MKIHLNFKNMIISIIVIMFLIGSMFLLSFSKKESKYFASVNAYFVCKPSNELESVNIEEINKIKRLGGAGLYLFENNVSYIVFGVYLSYDEAKFVLDQNLSNYNDLCIIKRCSNKISHKVQNKIKQNITLFSFFKELHDFYINYYNLQNSYLVGNITQSKFISKVLSSKYLFEKIISELKCNSGDENIFLVFANYSNIFLLKIESLMLNFYNTDDKSSALFSFSVEYTNLRIDFLNKLQKV